METKKIVIDLMNDVKDNCPVKFHNFGGFMFELFMFPVEEQKQIALKLHYASNNAEEKYCIVIHSIKKIDVTIDELKFAHQVQYDFRCSGCKQLRNETANLYGAVFQDWCEYCLDKAEEYKRDQGLERISGSDEDND